MHLVGAGVSGEDYRFFTGGEEYIQEAERRQREYEL
jgi:hypothetical protein